MYTLKNILKYLGLLLVTGVLAVSSHALAAQNPIVSALFETSLSGRILSTDTTMTLVSVKADPAGDTLPNGYTCFTLDGNNASNEFVCGTVTGTTVTGLTRGMSYFTGTSTVATLAVSHARGADVKISDYPALIIINNQLRGAESILNPLFYDGSLATSTIALNRANLVDWGLLQDTALQGSGAVAASTAAKGYVQIATQTQVASSTATGSAGALLVVPSSAATSTYNAQTAPLRAVVTQNSGKIDPNFIQGGFSINGLPLVPTDVFGNASDGNVVINAGATTTLTRDMYYNNLTVNGGLVTNGFRVFVQGTITGTSQGFVDDSGAAGNNASSGTAGATSTQICTFFCNSAGSAGIAGSTGNNIGSSLAGASYAFVYGSTTGAVGGTGGSTGAAGAAAGVGGTANLSTSIGKFFFQSLNDYEIGTSSASSGSTLFHVFSSAGASGGGGSAGNGGISGGGGSGGSSGDVVFISANNWAGAFNIQSKGGVGGNGGNGSCSTSSGGGAGGGGGNGGIAITIYGTKTWTGTYILTGGAGGALGLHCGSPGTDGTAGTSGSTGVSYEIPYTNI